MIPSLELVVSGTRDAERWHFDHVPLYVNKVFADNPARSGSIRVGCARGVDAIVRAAFTCQVYQACWDQYGKAAGMMRNEAMIDAAIEDAKAAGGQALLLAFPRDGGRGTQGAIKYARRRDLEVWEVRHDAPMFTIYPAGLLNA